MSKSTTVMPKGFLISSHSSAVQPLHSLSKHSSSISISDLNLQTQNQIEESSSTTHNERLKRKHSAPPTTKTPQLTPHKKKQVLKASFPSGFISMAPAADTDTASLASNATSSKSLSHSGPVNAGNDTYNFYDGDGGDGWPGMEQWVDFYSM